MCNDYNKFTWWLFFFQGWRLGWKLKVCATNNKWSRAVAVCAVWRASLWNTSDVYCLEDLNDGCWQWLCLWLKDDDKDEDEIVFNLCCLESISLKHFWCLEDLNDGWCQWLWIWWLFFFMDDDEDEDDNVVDDISL